ncbi:MAG TPA: hypothetical protein VHG28_09570 [Longimicrobiaceae bacterium]|nr:hypothetical protein [Longimicrobiaceae bacterium]
MTGTHIERRRPGVWPWILGLTVLALLIWATTERFGRSDGAADEVRRAPVPTPGRTEGTAAFAARLPTGVPHVPITDGRGLS